MKLNKSIIKGSATILLLSTLLVATNAQYNGKGECKNATKTCENVIPNLSEEQQEQISQMRTEHKAKMLIHKADLGVLKAELRKLEVESTPNQKVINSKIDEIFTLKSVMAKESSAHRQGVRGLLTEEQKVFFDSRHGKGCSYHSNRHGRRDGSGPKV